MELDKHIPVYYKDEQGTLLFSLPSTAPIPRIGETMSVSVWSSKVGESSSSWAVYQVLSVDTQVAFSKENSDQFYQSKVVILSKKASGINSKN